MRDDNDKKVFCPDKCITIPKRVLLVGFLTIDEKFAIVLFFTVLSKLNINVQ